jgi:hypothetical protein
MVTTRGQATSLSESHMIAVYVSVRTTANLFVMRCQRIFGCGTQRGEAFFNGLHGVYVCTRGRGGGAGVYGKIVVFTINAARLLWKIYVLVDPLVLFLAIRLPTCSRVVKFNVNIFFWMVTRGGGAGGASNCTYMVT